MSWDDFKNYNAYLGFMEKQLELLGEPVTCIRPSNHVPLGYENITEEQAHKLIDVHNVGVTYEKHETRCYINFDETKNLMFRKNYYPESLQGVGTSQDVEGSGVKNSMLVAFLPANDFVQVGCFIRTAVKGATSIWGDLLFEVCHIHDCGRYLPLKRIYFVQPTANKDLQDNLNI